MWFLLMAGIFFSHGRVWDGVQVAGMRTLIMFLLKSWKRIRVEQISSGWLEPFVRNTELVDGFCHRTGDDVCPSWHR